MLTLNDGRSELWQWDTGRTLAVDADCSQVHFSNKVFGRSIDVDVVEGAAIIPDVLLQTDKDLNVWAFVGTAENGYTKISKTFKVNRRNKPADYVFTPTDQTTIAEIAAIAQSVRDDADAGLFGGVQSDWNQNDSTAADYVKNRPFYAGDPVETIFVEESTVSFANAGGIYLAQFQTTFEATVGETYKVSWDGSDYECTCVDFNGYLAIGNLSVTGSGSDTGEPFFMGINNGKGFEIYTADTSASHTFSISGFAQEVVKIPEKYVNQHKHILVRDFWEESSESRLIDIVNQFNAGDVFINQREPGCGALLLYARYTKTLGFDFVYMDNFAIMKISGNVGNWTTQYFKIAFS